MQVLGPISASGGWWWQHHWTPWVTANGIAQTCFTVRAKDKFLLLRRATLQQKNQRL